MTETVAKSVLFKNCISGLYAITPDFTDTALLLNKTEQILAGGARLIQYRNKTAQKTVRFQQAKALLQLCRTYKASLIINDHLDLAIQIGADGIHLGQQDMDIPSARRQLGADKIVGASCYNQLALAVEAERNGADYVAFGAFFQTTTKHDTVVAPIDLLQQAKKLLHIPIVSIGGIHLTNVLPLIENGTDAVAVCHALYQTDTVCDTAIAFSRYFN